MSFVQLRYHEEEEMAVDRRLRPAKLLEMKKQQEKWKFERKRTRREGRGRGREKEMFSQSDRAGQSLPITNSTCPWALPLLYLYIMKLALAFAVLPLVILLTRDCSWRMEELVR